MSFLCTTRDKEVSYHQCMYECQYFFKSACIGKMNESYNQALEDFEMKIKECCSIVGSCDFEDMAKIKEQLRRN